MIFVRYFILVVIIAGFFGCAEVEPVVETVDKSAKTPVSVHTSRMGDTLNIDFIIPARGWEYTSVLSNDGMTYTLVLKDVWRNLGKIDFVRPILSYERKEYPSGFKLIFKLASRHKLSTAKNSLGLKVSLTALEPDIEMLSMQTFGGWADPERPADKLLGVEYKGPVSVLEFDAPMLYSTGKAGGRFYLDIFGMFISQGAVKHNGLAAINNIDHKTRFIFTKPVDICPDGEKIYFGKVCKGYSGLAGFKRHKNDKTESFEFSLPGRPEMRIVEKEHIVAFGFKDTRLFSQVFQRYNDGSVYKVEAREKDGLLWLIFLYNGELKYRKYYSGDKFFVVFFRGQS